MITRRRFFTAMAVAFIAKKLPVPKAAKKVVPWSTAPVVLPVGFIYAPYIPRYRKPFVLNPDDFKPRGILDHYSKAMIEDGKYLYAQVKII